MLTIIVLSIFNTHVDSFRFSDEPVTGKDVTSTYRYGANPIEIVVIPIYI